MRRPPVLHKCADCDNVTPIYDDHTLTVYGRKPTLGTCPHWTGSRCTLLSWRHICPHFKPRKVT